MPLALPLLTMLSVLHSISSFRLMEDAIAITSLLSTKLAALTSLTCITLHMCVCACVCVRWRACVLFCREVKVARTVFSIWFFLRRQLVTLHACNIQFNMWSLFNTCCHTHMHTCAFIHMYAVSKLTRQTPSNGAFYFAVALTRALSLFSLRRRGLVHWRWLRGVAGELVKL